MRNNRNVLNPATTYNIDDFIAMKNTDKLTYYNFSVLEKLKNIEFLNFNVIEEYLDILPVEKITLEPEQMARYRYKPDLLAYDLYGSTQLDIVILLINDMIDPKDFDRTRIYLPYASALSEFLDRVYTANYSLLQQNRLDNNIIL